MYIIVGLGNPGSKYEETRHNVGFKTIDLIAEKHGIKMNKIKFKALWGEGNICGEKVILAKPQTFMNNSGEALRDIVNYYDINLKNVIVIFDDIDIEFGKIRIKQKGSAGSHNGIKSIIYQTQRDDFLRIKIGIGKKGIYEDLADFVLGIPSKEDAKVLNLAIEKASEACEAILEQGILNSMNEYNKK